MSVDSQPPGDAALLRLLQVADSALPVGSAAHSFGLETLAEEAAVTPEKVEPFLEAYLRETGVLEAVFVRRAWRGGNLRAWNEELSARKLARESREASIKLGRRFAELVNTLWAGPVMETNLHYPIAFGAAGAACGIPVESLVLGYLHQSTAGLVSASQRLMPLGQAAASQILWNLKPAMVRAAERSRSEEAICFSPYLELASMRHGWLETRLFIS